MESLPKHNSIREEQALEHAYASTQSAPGSLPRGCVPTMLIDGLWALLQQPKPLTLQDVIQHLGLKKEDNNRISKSFDPVDPIDGRQIRLDSAGFWSNCALPLSTPVPVSSKYSDRLTRSGDTPHGGDRRQQR